MPSRVVNYFHVSQTTGTTALSTSFGTARAHNLTANLPPPQADARTWTGFLETVNIHVHAIAGGCTQLIVRVTSDAAGNESIVPDVTATIATGIGTATTGSVAISAGVGLTNRNPTQTDCIVYVWARTNAGTCDLKESTITWRE